MTDLIDWVNNELHIRGWSQTELSKRSGLKRSTISMTLNRHNIPSCDFIIGVADGFGYPRETVMRISGMLPKKPSQSNDLQILIDVTETLGENEVKAVLSFARWLQNQGGL